MKWATQLLHQYGTLSCVEHAGLVTQDLLEQESFESLLTA